MIDININKISKSYGINKIFSGISFGVESKERICITGPNGSGKTTILNLISGLDTPTEGTVSIRKGATIGYLPQIPPTYDETLTVSELFNKNIPSDFSEITNKLKELELKMQDPNTQNIDKVIARYCRLQEEYLKIEDYDLTKRLGKIIKMFNLEPQLEKPFNKLSGGEKRIVSLANCLISNPDILLLDEPTNHLDIATIESLESYLSKYPGTILFVSHDRYFIDRVATKIILIENGKSDIYFGNYTYYEKEFESRQLIEFKDYQNQQKLITAMEKKIKQLEEYGRRAAPEGEMFFKRANSIRKRLEKIELLDKPSERKEIPLNLTINSRSSNDVFEFKNLTLTIGSHTLLDNAKISLHYKEKVALIGLNGSGKSTLIKYILNIYENKLFDPKNKMASNLNIGYIPQEITFENNNETIYDYVKSFLHLDETHLRSTLAKYFFNGDLVYKKVGILSGGEKVRLKLLELITKKANLIILDEPTNHLDITTLEVLEDALTNYEGTILLVSHDRYFINKVCNKIISIEDKKLIEYLGNYTYYLQKRYPE